MEEKLAIVIVFTDLLIVWFIVAICEFNPNSINIYTLIIFLVSGTAIIVIVFLIKPLSKKIVEYFYDDAPEAALQ